MGAQLLAVAIDGGHMVGTLDLDVLLFALGGIRQVDLIGTDAAPVIIAAVLAVKGIRGMGQGHRGKGLVLPGKAGGGQKCLDSHVKSAPFKIACLVIR